MVNPQETQSPHTNETELLQNRSTIEGIIQKIEDSPISELFSKQTSIEDEVNGTKFLARFPHLRRGKHASVFIVDFDTTSQQPMSFVIRNDLEPGYKFIELEEKHPEIAKRLPKLYGMVNNWVVMEKLEGLELEELTQKLKSDENFSSTYAEQSFQLIQEAANAGLTLDDVMFLNGHNCMVSPLDSSIRIIEQDRYSTIPQRTINELIAKQLFDELRTASHGEPQRYQTIFIAQLLQEAFKTIPPDQLYVRGRVIKPTHPLYQDAYQMNGWGKISDERLKEILADPIQREGLTIPYFESGNTEALSLEFTEAIKENNLELINELLKAHEQTYSVMDKNDPRHTPITLEDDQ